MAEITKSNALITGASRGLGLALARHLARLGWSLILDARSEADLQRVSAELSALTAVITVPGDVTDAEHRARLLHAARSVGGLDVLINNASTLGPSPRPNLLDYPINALEAVYRTNVIAPLALIQTLQHDLKPQARIINVTSDAGVEPYAGWGGYGSSKAALDHLSAILANEKPEWRVYWVDPGDMRTQMHQEAFPGEDISDRDLPEASVSGFMTLIAGNLPSGRYRAKALQVTDHNTTGVQGMRLVLTVPDFQQAVAFYRDGLGLPIIDQWLSADSSGILLGAGQATLELIDKAQAAEVDLIEVGQPSVGSIRLAFVVDEIEPLAEGLQQNGAIPLSSPVLTPWRHNNQRFQAPTGLHDDISLTLSQVIQNRQPEVQS